MFGARPARVTWVATPPPGERPRSPQVPRRPYLGPPVYPAPPRWGFPQLAWRWPRLVPGTVSPAADSPRRVRTSGLLAIALLLTTATAALVSAGAETWRYVLLVASRDSLLSTGTVRASDMLTDIAGVLAMIFAVVSVPVCLAWVFRARRMAATFSGREPARPDWQVLIGLVVPGPNLVLPYSVLGELEHSVLRCTGRPRPSRLVRSWWLAWITGAVLFAVTFGWGFTDGVQAQADGVLLHVVLDMSAAVVAVLSALVVRRFTTLIVSPAGGSLRYTRVVRIDSAPEPPLRPQRPAGSVR